MTTVTFQRTNGGKLQGFICMGHAEAAAPGQDIVCASISILVINTINAIEEIAKDKLQVISNEEDCVIVCSFPSEPSHDAHVLLQALALGLTKISEQYSRYCKVIYQEV